MSDNKSSGGIGFGSLLLLAFIILKLTHYIDWSWWWVLSPVWITVAFVVLVVVVTAVIEANAEIKAEQKAKK